MTEHTNWHALVEEHLAAGSRLFQRGDHAGAADAYTAALAALAGADLAATERAALEAQLYTQRGHAHFIRRDLSSAVADYDQALARDPNLAEVYAYRALVRYQTGRTVQAVADYDAAIAIYTAQPLITDAQRRVVAEACFNRGNAQYQRRDYRAAEADYDQALTLAPDLLDALIFRGVARFQQGNASGAALDYHAALQHPHVTDLQQAQVRYNQGLLLRQAGNLQGAIAAYSAALTLQPRDANCLMNRGSAHAEGGDYAAAVADYRAALRLNPWIEDGFNTCGMARLLAGDLTGAIADFSRAIELHPQAANVHANRGGARLQSGDYAGAIADFTAELALRAPGLKGRIETREKRAEVLNNRGLAYHYSGQFEAALADYDLAIAQLRLSGGADSIGARLASTLLNRSMAQRDLALHGDSTLRQERLRRAAADTEQALALDPATPRAHEARQHLRDLQALIESDG